LASEERVVVLSCVFRSNRAKTAYRSLGIRNQEIERGRPWQSFIAATFNIQRRMTDFHLGRANTWEELVAEHDRWLSSYNVQRHWAHEGRKDGRRSPSAVLGPLTLLRHHPEYLEHAFFSTRFTRGLDPLGYARLKHWRIYGEEGLAARGGAVGLGDSGLVVECGVDTLARYDVSWSPGSPMLGEVTTPRLFATKHRPLQLKLFALEEALGQGWFAEDLDRVRGDQTSLQGEGAWRDVDRPSWPVRGVLLHPRLSPLR
jgi:hypothetical protein